MDQPLDIVAIIGSLRKGSFNRAVFDAAVPLFPAQTTVRELSLAEVPLYDGDVEAAGDPAAVAALKAAVDAADALVVFTPEYNRSVPAVTKNAIDWLSRPFGKGALAGVPVGIVAASPGRGDAPGARAHLSVAVAANTPRLFETTLGISGIAGKLEDGVLVDAPTLDRLRTWARDFSAFVRQSQP